ncbi:MAG: FAD-dependent oxidoreductase [Oscillochloris sp.]|nr:FAD-dependent oxidoreductase [Oscillochloris sp.]
MYGTVEAIDSSSRPFVLETNKGRIEAEALIVATGATPRKLAVPGEAELVGRGVSYIQSIPTLILFKHGKPVERIVGALPREQLMARITPHLNR